jgi:hypothetical protein
MVSGGGVPYLRRENAPRSKTWKRPVDREFRTRFGLWGNRMRPATRATWMLGAFFASIGSAPVQEPRLGLTLVIGDVRTGAVEHPVVGLVAGPDPDLVTVRVDGHRRLA